MRTLAALALCMAAALMAGCATRPAWLENRAACTADGMQLHAISVWGWFGISSRLAAADAAVICTAVSPSPGPPEEFE